ncbi:MAG TPA: neutral/alkaline non-lysosomal ceramidase N-terminal domain-containing protein [Blastocatellia bacterium]|nr:neutral/alkaline non-lysosomal ceramidase N-terminal domain-containing protein [Blastocatellia bacterium]
MALKNLSRLLALFALVACCSIRVSAQAQLSAGTGRSNITPPVGTPLAGYGARLGRPSTGVHDPTEARALIISSGTEKIAFVSVDHLGFDYSMVERVRAIAAPATGLAADRIFVMSSHTHGGGGAYLEIFPALAGRFDPKVRAFYEERAAEALIAASKNLRPALISFGAGEARGISRFRSSWPPGGPVDPSVGVIRVDSVDTRKPLAVLMNFAAHPTVTGPKNFEFSADFVGYARQAVERLVGGDVLALFANGAQGTIAPHAFQGSNDWERAENVGTILAAEVYKVLLTMKPQPSVSIKLVRSQLSIKPQPPKGFPAGVAFPDSYQTEVNAVTFDDRVAFVTIPGELTSILNAEIKARGKLLGYEHTFLLGLTNDALGYILTEDEYRHRTYESTISLFGPNFGSLIANEAFQLLEKLRGRPTDKQ